LSKWLALPFAMLASSPVPSSAQASERASMTCRVEAGSGRLLCTVSFSAPAESRVTWSDALVVAAPEAARPLRSRVTSQSGRPDQVVLAFVLGSGEGGRIEVLARAVTCPVGPREGACKPVESRVGFDFKPAS
jgi:hypothetical protein